MNIANWLIDAARRWPKQPALFLGAQQIADYRQFAASAYSRGEAFKSLYGIQAGDRVALYMKNAPEYLELLYAIWWVGAVAVPINCKLHASEAGWIAKDAEAKLIITDEAGKFELDALPEDCLEISQRTGSGTVLKNSGLTLPPVSRCAEDLAWLFYTSGTTGRSKGVMLSHGNLVAMSLCYPLDVDPVTAQDGILYAAPMSHGAGLYNFIHVRCGARHVFPESCGFKSDELFDLARTLEQISLFAAPTMIKRMVTEAQKQGYRGEGIKTIVYGGAPMYLADLKDAVDTFGARFVQIYGQGESPMTVTSLSREIIADREATDWERKASSVGRPHSCVEIKIVNSDRHILPAGLPGEVVVRGATVMQGYWKNETATHETLTDGWLYTGDIGFMDAEGYLTLTDRSKDVIITGGSNVYPREVEEVIALHPEVFEVCVVGEPDVEWGESIVAFIVVKDGTSIDQKSLESWFLMRMASFKKPKRYIFCDHLPKNSYGKILKTELRKRLMPALSRPGAA